MYISTIMFGISDAFLLALTPMLASIADQQSASGLELIQAAVIIFGIC